MMEQFLTLSIVLFSIGLYGALSRRNIIAIFMCIEIMLNAVNQALVTFSRYITPALMENAESVETAARSALIGQTFVIFIIVVAAAEIALGLALVIGLGRQRRTININDLTFLRR